MFGFGKKNNNKDAEQKRNARPRPLKARRFEAGASHRTLNEWISTSYAMFDEEIRQDLTTLRSRSRDASINDVYARRYFKALCTNVVGSDGVQYRMRVKNSNMSYDKAANRIFDEAFTDWSKNATVDGLSLKQAENLYVETTARDGECLVQLLRGKEYGKFGFQLRFIEADYLDHQYNAMLSNGNIVRAGVEYDRVGRIIAYHIWEYHPKDTEMYGIQNNKRLRVVKEDIIHGYSKERSSQGRGFPWLASSLLNLTHLKEYQKSELVAARVASAKMGFFTRPAGEEDILGDEIDEENGALIQEAEPGSFDILPEGYRLETFDPNNPNGNFPNFVKVILRGIAASLGVSYHTLANDLESTSYSSLRQGALEERETWKQHQKWLIESFLQPVFENWLKMALLTPSSNIRLPMAQYDKYNAIEWLPRTWAWIDPAKEANAIKTQLDNNLKSRTEIIRSMGRDFEDVAQEIASENELLKELGIIGTVNTDTETVVEDEQKEQKGNEDDE